jgi:hypothetical protein
MEGVFEFKIIKALKSRSSYHNTTRLTSTWIFTALKTLNIATEEFEILYVLRLCMNYPASTIFNRYKPESI